MLTALLCAALALPAAAAPDAEAEVARLGAELGRLEAAASQAGDPIRANCVREAHGQLAALHGVVTATATAAQAARRRHDGVAEAEIGARLAALVALCQATLPQATACRGGGTAAAAPASPPNEVLGSSVADGLQVDDGFGGRGARADARLQRWMTPAPTAVLEVMRLPAASPYQ